MNTTPTRRRPTALLLLASALVPGLGSMLAGAIGTGLLVLGVFLVSLRALLYPPTGVGVPLIVWLAGLVDVWLRIRTPRDQEER
ncbi:hypothetical protein [Nocardioides pakistanensis]